MNAVRTEFLTIPSLCHARKRDCKYWIGPGSLDIRSGKIGTSLTTSGSQLMKRHHIGFSMFPFETVNYRVKFSLLGNARFVNEMHAGIIMKIRVQKGQFSVGFY